MLTLYLLRVLKQKNIYKIKTDIQNFQISKYKRILIIEFLKSDSRGSKKYKIPTLQTPLKTNRRKELQITGKKKTSTTTEFPKLKPKGNLTKDMSQNLKLRNYYY